MTLQSKIQRGLTFVFLSTMGSRLVALCADVALMRLLLPAEHGVMHFGMVVVGALALLRSLGVGEALVFRSEVDRKSCDSAFILSAGVGLVLYGVVYAGAPLLASWLAGADQGQLVEVLRALAVIALLQGVGTVPSALLERELAFDKKIYVDALPTLIYALIALPLAWSGYGVWSLVWGRVLSAAAGQTAAWKLISWRPRWRFDMAHVRQLSSYGRYVSAAAIVSFLVVSIDDVFVARLGGERELGLYARAYLLANVPVTAVAHVVGRVAFPAFAQLVRAGEEVGPLYVQMLGSVALLTLPMALLLALLAEPFTVAFLGAAWLPMVPILQGLAAYGFLRSLLSNTGPLFNGLGTPQTILKINGVQLMLLALLLYPLIARFGGLGAVWGILVASLLSAPLAMRYVKRHADIGWVDQLRVLQPLVLPAALAAGAVIALRYALQPLGGFAVCLGAGIGGSAAYIGWLYGARRPFFQQALAVFFGGKL